MSSQNITILGCKEINLFPRVSVSAIHFAVKNMQITERHKL